MRWEARRSWVLELVLVLVQAMARHPLEPELDV